MLSNSTDKQASSMRTVAYVDVVSLCIQPFLDVLTCNLSIMCQAIVLQCISFFGLGIVYGQFYSMKFQCRSNIEIRM